MKDGDRVESEITDLRRVELEESAKALAKLKPKDIPPDLPIYDRAPKEYEVELPKLQFKIAPHNQKIEDPDAIR